jgi:uncharacterized protein (UPF0332 family)
MDGKDFLGVSKRLYKSVYEADRRTSISRAYYALLNHVKSFLELKGIYLPQDHTTHKKIYLYLHNSGIEEAEDIAGNLDSFVSPEARRPSKRETGKRSPRMHGLPVQILGSIVIRLNFIFTLIF